MRVLRVLTIAALWGASLGVGASSFAECVRSPQMAVMYADSDVKPIDPTAPQQAVGGTTHDRYGRVIAPVMVNGQGPYPFIVDTGANRSVLSHGLADSLGLLPDGVGDVHSINSVEQAPLVQVNALRFGGVALNNASLPLLGAGMMDGGVGILGVDGMRGKRLRIDFERQCLEVMPARGALPLSEWVRIRGVLRFGHLVMLQGLIVNLRVNVLIDTGSDTSMANTAFRDAVVHHFGMPPIPSTRSRALTAGRPIVLNDGILVPGLQLGDVTLGNVPAYIGDYHIFDLWGLQQEPTILIGMDVLRYMRAIAIDYSTGMVQFRRPAREVSRIMN